MLNFDEMKEPTIKDVIVSVKDISVRVKDVFELLEQTAVNLSGEISDLRKEVTDDISGIKGEISGIKEEISGIKGIMATMVTKDYLDQKFAEYSADHDVKEWKAHLSLVDVLSNKVELRPKDIRYLKKARFIRPTT